MSKSSFKVTTNDNTVSTASEAGYRARQAVERQREADLRRRVGNGPSKPIPIAQGICNILVALIIAGILAARTKNTSGPPPIPTHESQDAMIQAVRNGTYKHKGIFPVPTAVYNEQKRLGLRD